LTHYSSTLNFSDICRYAIEKVNQLDFVWCCDDDNEEVDCNNDNDESNNNKKIIQIKNPDTIMLWWRTFCVNSSFPNPAA
jgi:hypothetical protein